METGIGNSGTKHSMKRVKTILYVLFLLLYACTEVPKPDRKDYKDIEETKIREIPLYGELADRNAEISGLAWCEDQLILLPQYPQMYKGEYNGVLFAIDRSDLVKWKNNKSDKVMFRTIGINFNGLDEDLFDIGSGFESVAFLDKDVYFTVESSGWFDTKGYVLKGKISEDLSYIDLFSETLHEIPSQSGVTNLSEEAILIADSLIYTFHEANGVKINPSPVSHSFTLDLTPHGNIPLDNLEYRITDATSVDSLNRFWVINYLFPEDWNDLKVYEKREYEFKGIGISHKQRLNVERLVEYQVSKDRILRTNSLPVYVELGQSKGGRNWEGIVRFSDGFLIITDKYPRTILAFVEKHKNNSH